MDPRIARLQELFRVIEQATAEIAAMLVPAPTSTRTDLAVRREHHQKGTPRPCCGSMGARHKNGCQGNGKQTTADAWADDDLKTYTCSDCHHLFQDEREYLDVVCPSCDGHACIQKH